MAIVLIAVIIVVTLFLCYFTSGISNLAGTVFEKKSGVSQKSEKNRL